MMDDSFTFIRQPAPQRAQSRLLCRLLYLSFLGLARLSVMIVGLSVRIFLIILVIAEADVSRPGETNENFQSYLESPPLTAISSSASKLATTSPLTFHHSFWHRAIALPTGSLRIGAVEIAQPSPEL